MHRDETDWIPFIDAPWSADQKEQFEFILQWRRTLQQLSPAESDASALKSAFEAEADQLIAGESTSLLPKAVVDNMKLRAQRDGLPLEWFASQVRVAHRYYHPMQFATGKELKEFLTASVVAQGKLIAKLADVAHGWQLPQVSDLATAFHLVDKLVNLPAEMEKGRLYIPLSDLEQAGVTVDEIEKGVVDARTQKLLWKQIIRIRDAFAQGQPLVKEVPRKFRRTFKKNWLTGLELVGEIERRQYDLWSEPIVLSKIQKFQIAILSIIGKGAAKARG